MHERIKNQIQKQTIRVKERWILKRETGFGFTFERIDSLIR